MSDGLGEGRCWSGECVCWGLCCGWTRMISMSDLNMMLLAPEWRRRPRTLTPSRPLPVVRKPASGRGCGSLPARRARAGGVCARRLPGVRLGGRGDADDGGDDPQHSCRARGCRRAGPRRALVPAGRPAGDPVRWSRDVLPRAPKAALVVADGTRRSLRGRRLVELSGCPGRSPLALGLGRVTERRARRHGDSADGLRSGRAPLRLEVGTRGRGCRTGCASRQCGRRRTERYRAQRRTIDPS